MGGKQKDLFAPAALAGSEQRKSGGSDPAACGEGAAPFAPLPRGNAVPAASIPFLKPFWKEWGGRNEERSSGRMGREESEMLVNTTATGGTASCRIQTDRRG